MKAKKYESENCWILRLKAQISRKSKAKLKIEHSKNNL